MLEKLITRHRLGLQADGNCITSDWLSARCHDSFYLRLIILFFSGLDGVSGSTREADHPTSSRLASRQ